MAAHRLPIHAPAGSKYSRAYLDYTIVSGSGSGTNWTINYRNFSGSTGLNNGPLDAWRLRAMSDWSWNGSGWTKVGDPFTCCGGWRTDQTWSPTFTAGASQSINGTSNIAVLTFIEHRNCVWTQPDGVNWQCLSSTTYVDQQDNQAWN